MTSPGVPRYPPLALTPGERRGLVDLLSSVVRVDSAATAPPSPPAREATHIWSALAALAEGHGVAALVAPVLAPQAPQEAARQLEDAAARTLARGERLAVDAERVGAALLAAALPFAWIKGAWLAPRLYEPAAARPLADLDLLVTPGTAEAAVGVLASLGYLEIQRTWKHRVYLLPHNRAVVDLRGEHPDNPRPVELHTRLGESFRGINLDLTGALPLDQPASELPAHLALAHLAAHATVDALGRRARLIQWVDLARQAAVLEEGGWDALVDLAATPHAARFVWPALALAARSLGAPVPPRVRSSFGGAVSPALGAWIAGVDLDAVSVFGQASAARALGEIPSIWPRSGAERMALWRFILLPGRWQLADRYPRLARSRVWPLMYARHAAYNTRRMVTRWRQTG